MTALTITLPDELVKAALAEAASAADAKRIRWIAVKDAPRYCGLSKSSFYELLKKFLPPVAEIGERTKVYASTNLDAMMAANQTAGGKAVSWPVTAADSIKLHERAA